ncbi:PREDICTED: uncharacterized protein LOC102824343 [Chrysochloris asiatica]|uniref:Uncharacterized protein LOC102824343 n=1 Tax=Chrysochloris asiatica TaxID=185453 RepID=A0A9B0UC86_CHRAS|nr:PREDICTED: uncharacterized protein LOC102824343 [Chrysochloris asiatica]
MEDPLGCIQDEVLPLLREGALDSSHDCSRPLWLDEAGGHKISAGQVTEGPCTRAKQYPPVLVKGPETLSVLLGDLTGSECEQLVLAVPPPEEQDFLLLCGCAPVQCIEGSPQSSEQNLATTSASGPFTLTQTSSPLLWGSIEEPTPLTLLLIPEPSPEAQRIQEGLGARHLLSPKFVRHCCRDHHQAWDNAELHDESPPIPNAGCPGGGLMKTLTEGVTLPGWSVEQSGAVRSLVCPTFKCPWHPETPGALVSAQKPRSEAARLAEPPGPEGSPLSFSGKVEVQGQAWDRLGGLWSEEEVSPSAILSRAHRTEETLQPGGQLWAEKDGAGGRGEEGKEEKQVCTGQAEHLWEGQEEKQHQVGAGPGGMDVLESLPVNGCDGRDTLCLMEEQGWLRSANGSGAPSTDGDWYLNEIDALEGEMAACIQHLSTLPVGSWGVQRQTSMPSGENWSFARKWPSLEDGAHTSHASVSYTVDVCAAEEATAPKKVGKEAVPGRAGSLRAWKMPPRAVPRPDSTGLEQDWLSGALEQMRTRCNLLFTRLRNERSSVLWGDARLRGDQERSHRKVQTLERERERQEQRVSDLQQDNSRLSAAVAHLRTEVEQYLQLISDLEDCNGKNYLRISKLDEEKEVLRGKLAQTKREMSESRQRVQGRLEHALRENTQIWTLVSELRTSYKGLLQDIVLAMEDVTQGLQAQNMRLLCRVQMLEQMTMTGVYPNMGSGEIRGQCNQVGAVDKAVQVAQLPGHKPASIQGPSWDEDMGQDGVQGHSPSGTEHPGISAHPTALLPTWGNVSASGVLSGNMAWAGVEETGVNTEERGPPCSGNHRRELRGVDAEATKEELRLQVGQLHHQVLTLKCQLRDQGSLHRELQESQEEAGHLREQLHNQRKEFQHRQHEADLAATPLKAKVASLVRKCQERNGLITHLLRELQRHGAASLPLAECAQSMVADEALAQYAATFLTTGVQEGQEALHTDSFPAPSELLSPARILASYKDLRQSICIHSQVNKSPLDVQV